MRPDIWIARHGPTEWSEAGRHTSRTDLSLTEAGRTVAAGLAPVLAGHDFALVLGSPAARALETAHLAGFEDAEIDADLLEMDYGTLEGLTTAEIRARGSEWADWTVWKGPIPGGETPEHVAARARRVIARADGARGDVLIFGHGHQLRVLTAVALDLPPTAGAHLVLDAGGLSVIGHERDTRALRSWNWRLEESLGEFSTTFLRG